MVVMFFILSPIFSGERHEKTNLSLSVCTAGLLRRQYLALDMAVYAGHANLLLLTASLPLLLMWVLVIINMLPFYSFRHCHAGCPAFAGYPGHPVNGGGCDCQPE